MRFLNPFRRKTTEELFAEVKAEMARLDPDKPGRPLHEREALNQMRWIVGEAEQINTELKKRKEAENG